MTENSVDLPLSDPLDQAMRLMEEAEATGADALDLSNLGLGPISVDLGI